MARAGPIPGPGAQQGELILKVGGQDEMKTRNLLPAIASDTWTTDVLDRAYHGVLLSRPVLDRPMAFIAKGVDYDEDGLFEMAEYDTWAEQAIAATPLNITAYYDFNGVRWHDGVQMTPWDLLFSYHLNAMNARFNTDIRILFAGGTSSSYEGGGRQLNIDFTAKNWEGEGTLPGDLNLRVAVEFRLTVPFVRFYESTLDPVMLPMHEWSRTGGLRPSDGSVRHTDFGCAIWIPPAEASLKGIPACGNTDPATWGKGIASTETVMGSHPYYYNDAEAWNLRDEDIIGNGPFEFESFIKGVEAKVIRYEKYFVGVDPDTPSIVYDSILVQRLKKPTIEGIRFLVYKTTQLGVFALQTGEIDFYHWNVPAEFVPDLLKIPEIAVESNAEPGFTYMAYNFRRQPWGYVGGNPANGDLAMGYWLRQAFSHLIDKKSIVQNLLQNYGVVGHGTVSPANTFWYNDNIPKPDFNLTQAASILDDMATAGGNIPPIAGFTLDQPGGCSMATPGGCRSLPTIENGAFDILTPQADYDPVRASAGAMVADAMRRVGLNAVSRPTAFGQIVNQINARDFDLYILDWRIRGTDPDYLFSFFHSSNAAAGLNYPGFQNATFDQVIEDSRAELDRNTRQSLIFEAQRVLADSRPYDVLYFRTNIEGYRQDRFVNRTVESGTIWNYWSLQGIHPPSSPSLSTSIAVSSAMMAGSTNPIAVTVFENEFHQVVPGASVAISVDSREDQGNVSVGGGPAAKTVYGTTDANGQVLATYHAADVSSDTSVVIRTVTTHTSYADPFARSAIVRVFPTGVQFLSLRLGLPFGNIVEQGSSVPMSVNVTDQDANPALGANVDAYVDPPGSLFPSPSSGNATEMSTVTLTADSTAGLGDYRVMVLAQQAGFTEAMAEVWVSVVTPSTSTHTVTIDTVPSGLQVSVDGLPLTAPVISTCEADTTVTVSAGSPQGGGGTRYDFVSWSDGGARTHDVTCTGDVTIVASFTTLYQVTLESSPSGREIVFDGQTHVAPESVWCPKDSVVIVRTPPAQEADGYRFVFEDWSDGGELSHSLTCSAPATLLATFSTDVWVVVSTAPPGLRIVVEGAEVAGTSGRWCDQGSELHVTAPLEQGSDVRYRWASWSDGGNQSHVIECSEPAEVTAMFESMPTGVGDIAVTLTAVVIASVGAVAVFLLWRRRRRRQSRKE